jgi:hypothetical protein
LSLLERRSFPQAAARPAADKGLPHQAVLDEVRFLFSQGMSTDALAAFSQARAVVGWEPLTAAVAEGLAAYYGTPDRRSAQR